MEKNLVEFEELGWMAVQAKDAQCHYFHLSGGVVTKYPNNKVYMKNMKSSDVFKGECTNTEDLKLIMKLLKINNEL